MNMPRIGRRQAASSPAREQVRIRRVAPEAARVRPGQAARQVDCGIPVAIHDERRLERRCRRAQPVAKQVAVPARAGARRREPEDYVCAAGTRVRQDHPGRRELRVRRDGRVALERGGHEVRPGERVGERIPEAWRIPEERRRLHARQAVVQVGRAELVGEELFAAREVRRREQRERHGLAGRVEGRGIASRSPRVQRRRVGTAVAAGLHRVAAQPARGFAERFRQCRIACRRGHCERANARGSDLAGNRRDCNVTARGPIVVGHQEGGIEARRGGERVGESIREHRGRGLRHRWRGGKQVIQEIAGIEDVGVDDPARGMRQAFGRRGG
jgi:hypothetical protein